MGDRIDFQKDNKKEKITKKGKELTKNQKQLYQKFYKYTNGLDIPLAGKLVLREELLNILLKNPDCAKNHKNNKPKNGKNNTKENNLENNNISVPKSIHTIDVGLTDQQKTNLNLGESIHDITKISAVVKFNSTVNPIEVLYIDLGDGAIIYEYTKNEFVPSNIVGQQLFNKLAIQKMNLEDKLYSQDEIKRLYNKNKMEFAQILEDSGSSILPGYFDSESGLFKNIDQTIDFILKDDKIAYFSKGKLFFDVLDETMATSLLIKQ